MKNNEVVQVVERSEHANGMRIGFGGDVALGTSYITLSVDVSSEESDRYPLGKRFMFRLTPVEDAK